MGPKKPKHGRRTSAVARDSREQLLGRADSHYTAGELDTAERLYREVLAEEPATHRAVFMLGMIEYLRRAFSNAQTWLESAIALNGNVAHYWLYQGRTLEALRQNAAALVHYKRARQLDPSLLEAWLCEGKLFRDLAAPAQAQATYEAAAAIHSNDAVLQEHLGELALSLDRLDEAAAYFEAAQKLDPQLCEAWINLGTVRERMGRLEQARSCYTRACELDGKSVTALTNLVSVLHDLGEIDEALARYRRLLELAPSPVHHSSMVALMLYDPSAPPKAVLAEATRWSQRYAPARSTAPHALTALARAPRLRIGYVSADFRQHAVMHFIEPVIAAHAASRFEVICYSNSQTTDYVTERLARHACVQSIRGLSDEHVAAQIRADGIHVLVDLSGHTHDHRLALFSLAPAPVQATYVGYPGTTGVSAIDYRFTDGLADPEPLADGEYSEKLVRLPGGFCCFKPLRPAPDVNALPRLERGYITFGSLNNYTKLSATALRTWAQVMTQLPDSRLILQSKPFIDPAIRERVWERFAAHGIARDRIELHDLRSLDEHLALYNQIDIALDTFPWNGHTTTCLALHMGVPVVVLEGDRFGSRMGVSVMTRAGLTDWVAPDLDRYVALAVERAQNVDGLRELRGRLREQLERSPLGDAAGFTRELEAAYERLWHEHLASASEGGPVSHAAASGNALPRISPAEKVRFVVATRERKDSFSTETAIGKSLSLYPYEFVQLRLFPENKRGLPEIYNLAIEEARLDPALLVFIHDDVHILDYFWAERLRSSLERFGLIGLAGNKRRVPRQPSWAFIDDKWTWDQPANLSGVVGHGKAFPPSNISVFGKPDQEVKLLDGLMLAAHSRTLIDNELRFDERFDFHFYDLDFCRQAELKGLSLGTCALPVIHESGGGFGSESWQHGYQKYLEKWKD